MKICTTCGELVPQGCCTCGPRQRILQHVNDPQEIAKDLVKDWKAPFFIMDGRDVTVGEFLEALVCAERQATVDACAMVVEFGPDTDDPEAPLMLAGDQQMLCGGSYCEAHND
jgi:hypothetical protein